MRMDQILEEHKETFIVMLPDHRNSVTNKPITYKVLQTFGSRASCEKALDYYDAEGFKDMVAVPNFQSLMRIWTQST